jgi:hypothetical protein
MRHRVGQPAAVRRGSIPTFAGPLKINRSQVFGEMSR